MKWPFTINKIAIMLCLLCLHPFWLAGQPSEGTRINNDTAFVLQQINTAEDLMRGMPDSAKTISENILNYSRRINYRRGIRLALLKIAETQQYTGEFQTALDYAHLSLEYSDTLTDRTDLAYIYAVMGTALGSMSKYSEAFHTYSKAIELAPESFSKLPVIYNNMGDILQQLGEYHKAHTFFNKAIAIALQNPSLHEISGLYISRGKVAQQIYSADIKKAELDFDSAIHYGREYGQYTDLIGALAFKANLYLNVQQHEKALNAIAEAESILEQHKTNVQRRAYMAVYFGAAEVALSLKQYSKAEDYFKKLKALTANDPFIRAMTMHKLSNLYSLTGNYKDAYIFYLEAHGLFDSIKTTETKVQVNELETKYRSVEKDKALAEKNVRLLFAQQQLNRKNFWITTLLGSATLMVFIFIAIYQRQKLRIQKARVKEQDVAIAQLSAVLTGEENERARIGRQLHDDVMVSFSIAKINLAALPNAYPAIKSSAAFENLSRQLNQTGVKIRQTAHNLMPDALLTEGLLFAISYFCNGINKTSELQVRFQHYGTLPDLPIETQVNLYRIVQELVQNVVKHAQASEALVQLYSREDAISITVDDDGRGIADPDKAESGLGLKSIRSRLRVMGGEMDIRSVDPHGTAVHIEVKL